VQLDQSYTSGPQFQLLSQLRTAVVNAGNQVHNF